MKKKILFSLFILFIGLLIYCGSVQAVVYTRDTFQIDFPNGHTVESNPDKIMSESKDGRDAIILEFESNTSNSVCNSDFVELFIQLLKEQYGDSFTVISSKVIEKNACMVADVVYSDTLSGDLYYAEVYVFKSDNNIYTLSFLSYDKNYLSSAEKNKVLNSFKIKDTVTSSYGLPFTDVPTKEWYRSAVEYVYNNNIIKGLNNYTFGPNDKLTRGMMVTILYRMAGSPKVSGTSKFKDVKNTKEWYYNAVLWAANNKIASGYDNGNFGPNDNITREQLAVFLYKYAKFRGKNVSASKALTGFKDGNKVSSYATSQMKWAVGAGVITGNNNTNPPTLNPQGTATRAEAASMLYKYCTKIGK